MGPRAEGGAGAVMIRAALIYLLLAGCAHTGPQPFESSGVVAPKPGGCTANVDC